MKTAAEKAAGRAAAYRRSIAALQAAGQGREALHEALRWLRSEAAHAARLRPGSSAALHDQLIAQVMTLAGALADPGRTGVPSRAARLADRKRRSIAALQAGDRNPDRDREALSEAVLWLQAAAAGAPGACGELAARIACLAAEIPGWRPGRRHH